MLGAIIGDVVGSRFEFNNIKTKKFNLFDKKCNGNAHNRIIRHLALFIK